MRAIHFDLKQNKERLVIAGLGNPGKEYAETRHNAGFLFIDRLHEFLLKADFDAKIKIEKSYILISFPDLNLDLIKPQTMMNLSGKALNDYYRYHKKFSAKSLVVVHDDLDLALGDYKINVEKGPRLHNGLRSIELELGTAAFNRIRLGIENRNGLPISGLDYVLYKFKNDELKSLEACINKILEERFSY